MILSKLFNDLENLFKSKKELSLSDITDLSAFNTKSSNKGIKIISKSESELTNTDKEKLKSIELQRSYLELELKERSKFKRKPLHHEDFQVERKHHSKAFDYVTADDILKDSDYIDSPFILQNLGQLREAGLSMAESKQISDQANKKICEEINTFNKIMIQNINMLNEKLKLSKQELVSKQDQLMYQYDGISQ